MQGQLPYLPEQLLSLVAVPKSTHLVLRPLNFDDVNGTPA
jgi:hypothetical protein